MGLRCPFCSSEGVVWQRTTSTKPSYYEYYCNDCDRVGGGFEGDVDEAAWQDHENRESLRQIIARLRAAGYDSLAIANDPEALGGLKRVAEKRGDLDAVKLIQEMIDELGVR